MFETAMGPLQTLSHKKNEFECFFDRVTNAMEVSSEGNEPAEVHLDLTVAPNADANASTTVTPEGNVQTASDCKQRTENS
ncbi:hypothetical protein CEXT_366231 [Caerostris extrusa]|uniref:Uncharacterized protein n=1 Tax=Caerostris extrusa TaxID=172846 RepID=A0AAV4NJZ7_CAEEX|nr:hypothetical protein CEXT_366231 [Caerostris extrusa]